MWLAALFFGFGEALVFGKIQVGSSVRRNYYVYAFSFLAGGETRGNLKKKKM